MFHELKTRVEMLKFADIGQLELKFLSSYSSYIYDIRLLICTLLIVTIKILSVFYYSVELV